MKCYNGQLLEKNELQQAELRATINLVVVSECAIEQQRRETPYLDLFLAQRHLPKRFNFRDG